MRVQFLLETLFVKFTSSCFSGFLTLPTAYVTGNPVECVLHPSLWNESGIWESMGVGELNVNSEEEYEEENMGYPVTSVSNSIL